MFAIVDWSRKLGQAFDWEIWEFFKRSLWKRFSNKILWSQIEKLFRFIRENKTKIYHVFISKSHMLNLKAFKTKSPLKLHPLSRQFNDVTYKYHLIPLSRVLLYFKSNENLFFSKHKFFMKSLGKDWFVVIRKKVCQNHIFFSSLTLISMIYFMQNLWTVRSTSSSSSSFDHKNFITFPFFMLLGNQYSNNLSSMGRKRKKMIQWI